MKVAITYENGEVFPHFGRTPQFKIYDIEENTYVSRSFGWRRGSRG